MKYFLVLVLCLTAVFAEEVEQRPCFHCLHYNQHSQTVEEAKSQISDVVGADSQFEAVGGYGAAGNVVGQESAAFGAQSGANFGAESNFGSQFGAESGSSFGAQSGSSFGAQSGSSFGAQSGSSFGAQSGSSFGAQSSYGVNSAANFAASSALEASNNVESVASGVVIPVVEGSSAASYVEHAQNVHEVQPVILNGGSSGSENYVQQVSHRVEQAPVVTYPAGHESYLHHEERHVEKQAVPIVTYTAPSGYDSYMKYRKVVSSSPQIQPAYLNSVSTNSQLGSLVSGALTAGAAQNVHSGLSNQYQSGFGSSYGANSALNAQHRYGVQSGFGSNAAFNSGASFGAQQNLASFAQQSAALHAAQQNAASFAAQQSAASVIAQQQALLAAQRQQAAIAAQQQSAFGSKLATSYGSNAAFNSGFGASGGLNTYMSEAERLAKEQSQGLSVGGVRTGGTVLGSAGYNAGLESGALGNYNAAAVNNGGYKTKSWEKASKWASQSAYDSNGNVNNYKELSTGESEQYDINGKRVGYKAATSTLDDNGKISSYSLHT